MNCIGVSAFYMKLIRIGIRPEVQATQGSVKYISPLKMFPKAISAAFLGLQIGASLVKVRSKSDLLNVILC